MRKKNFAIYALLRCKIFSLKIWLCKIFDKFHVWGRVAFVSLPREFRSLILKNFLRGNEEYWVQRSDPKTLWADEVEIGPLGRLAERRRQNLRQDCWRRIENSAEVFCTLSRSGTSGAASGVVEPPSTGSQRWVHKYFFCDNVQSQLAHWSLWHWWTWVELKSFWKTR